MRFLYVEGVATHGDPESCVCPRKGVREALTGERAGMVLSPEKMQSRVPTLWTEAEGNTERCENRECRIGPCVVGDPLHVRKLHAREPGGPAVAHFYGRMGSEGKA